MVKTISALLFVGVVTGCTASAQPPAAPVDRASSSAYYMRDRQRAMLRSPDPYHMQFYPIPHETITRATYMKWLEDSDCLAFADEPKRGLDGPAEMLPVLAKYVQTHDAKYGDACVVMLKDFYRGLQEDVEKNKARDPAHIGWTERFIEEPAYIPLYRHYLIEGGLLKEPQDTWFRDMYLYYARHLHTWNDPSTFWRGPCHRSQPDGIVHGLAAKWYPDIPEAADWRKYSEQVFGDIWAVKDITENDTLYSTGPTFANMTVGEELRGNDDFITNPEMRKIWERDLAEITPDGAINPYGPNHGWNSTAPWRIWMLELAAAKTHDGRYRYGAHKLMNYLLYQKEVIRRDRGSWIRETTEKMALAWLFTDDSIKPVEPTPGSQILNRKQVGRVGNKEDASHFLKDLDPAPDRGRPCDNLIVLNETVPTKLVLRSGWNPGDFFALIDLFIGADPLNPTGIVGLTRWGAPFTQAVSAKGSSEENRIVIEDLSGRATRRYQTNPYYVRGESWGKGKQSTAATVTVPIFEDMNKATFAAVSVPNYESLPVNVVREFAFIKNRFLLVRDIVQFDEGFNARVSPVWNTQNIGPQVGANFANTFFTAPIGNGEDNPMKTVPYDLLVYFAPRPDCHLQVVDRTEKDARTEIVPAQLRYTWEGNAGAGQKMVFTQVYYPHVPEQFRPSSNVTGAQREWVNGEKGATAGASGIKMLIDTPTTSVAKLSLDPDRTEWVICNPGGEKITVDGMSTDARYAYIDVNKGKIITNATAATFLTLDGNDIFRQSTRGNITK